MTRTVINGVLIRSHITHHDAYDSVNGVNGTTEEELDSDTTRAVINSYNDHVYVEDEEGDSMATGIVMGGILLVAMFIAGKIDD